METRTSWRSRKEVMWERGLLAMGWIHLRRNLGVLERSLSSLSGCLENVGAGGTDWGLFDG
jgi:hypothetical protein